MNFVSNLKLNYTFGSMIIIATMYLMSVGVLIYNAILPGHTLAKHEKFDFHVQVADTQLLELLTALIF